MSTTAGKCPEAKAATITLKAKAATEDGRNTCEGVHPFQEKRGWRPGAPRPRTWGSLAEGLKGSRGVLGVVEQDSELRKQTSEKIQDFRAPGDQEVLEMFYNVR